MKKLPITIAIFSLCTFLVLLVFWFGRDSVLDISREETLASSIGLPAEVIIALTPSKVNTEKKTFEENVVAEEQEDSFGVMGAWVEAIKNSRRPNDLLYAAIMSADQVEQEVFLIDAYALDPENILLNYQILQFCLHDNLSTLCSFPVVDTLSRIDGDNLYTTIVLSAFFYELGDVETAMIHLQRIGEASNTDDFYSRYREALDESIAYHHYERDLTNYFFNIGVVAAIHSPHYGSIMSMCNAQVASGVPEWGSLCSAYGASLAERGSSIADQQIGLAIQLNFSGLSKEKAEAFGQPRRKKYSSDLDTMQALSGQLELESNQNKIISDEQWKTYLKIYRVEGEMAAVIYLAQVIDEQ